MAFLAECPCCHRRKRVDESRRSDGAFPIAECPSCSIAFAVWPDENGTAIGIELQPGWR